MFCQIGLGNIDVLSNEIGNIDVFSDKTWKHLVCCQIGLGNKKH